jgi:hypothetical protein
MLGTGAKRFDFHQSKPHHRTNRNGDRCRHPHWGVAKATEAIFLGTLLPAAFTSVAQTRPSPPPWLRQLAPGDTSIWARVKAIRTPMNHDVALRLLTASALTGRGFGPRDRRCCILGTTIELKLAV